MRIFRIRNILFFLFFVSLFLAFYASKNQEAALWIEKNISLYVRLFVSKITSVYPASVFELLIYAVPIVIVLLFVFGIEKKLFLNTLAVISFVSGIYVFTSVIPSYAPRRFCEYDIPPTKSELVCAAQMLISDINESPQSTVPSLSEIEEKIKGGYAKISHGYGIEGVKLPNSKPIVASRAASYLGILALYLPHTSEVCINTDIPSYLIPVSLAHEYAHFVGVFSEGEANFLAYVASLASGDRYAIYSASLSTLQYILSDIARLDFETYTKLYNLLSDRAKLDLENYRDYTDKYSGSKSYIISDKLSSLHGEVVGGAKPLSYSAVSRYVTAYLLFS